MSDQLNPEPIPPSGLPTTEEKPEIDVSRLPSLPPAGSKAWRGSRRNTGRWRGIGCGCGFAILIVAIVVAYQGLRSRVWSSYVEVCKGVERSILVEVGAEEKQRLLDNLEQFQIEVPKMEDPYPAIGRFVAAGRDALIDFVVDPQEAERLNLLLEEEIADFKTGGAAR